ncbi:coiled-coil domain-containing protein 169-like isoform X11 [Crassostrea angulata]|uniref:coiled-coil domain-containing protein 169-like isoform X11 n=1 Tax=Magallana angulata TaxID=2784310 RepID=UPI0022B13080|nr:coiled-coil domain-containing protein 169-like isoform X11 [Crassostrea angulata]
MAVEVMDDFELEKLRAEIQQEKQMKEMLEQSAAELRATVEELEKRYDTIDNEDRSSSKQGRSSASSSDDLDWNEWKTRYETQTEINEQLERQILMLQNKVQEAKANLKDARDHVAAGKTPRDLKNFDDLSDANPHMIRMLEKEKNVLMNQMRDMEWRLDQESKAYHKANDERKTYSLEINSTKGSINDFSTRTKLSSSRDALDTIPGSRTPRSMGSRISLNEMDENSSSPSPRRSKIKTVRNTNYRSLRNLENEIRNIPEDQRILDPKHGPIKKAAAVKSLPSLETT